MGRKGFAVENRAGEGGIAEGKRSQKASDGGVQVEKGSPETPRTMETCSTVPRT